MIKNKLKVIKGVPPEGGIIKDDDGPHLIGHGFVDYVCGNCGNIILKSMSAEEANVLQQATFRCKCKTFNRF